MTELAAPQISSLMEALPGIAAVLRSPVATAIVDLIRAGVGLRDFRLEDAEELLKFGVRRNLLDEAEAEQVLAEVREAVGKSGKKPPEPRPAPRTKPIPQPARKPAPLRVASSKGPPPPKPPAPKPAAKAAPKKAAPKKPSAPAVAKATKKAAKKPAAKGPKKAAPKKAAKKPATKSPKRAAPKKAARKRR
jgi:hypothetical protein